MRVPSNSARDVRKYYASLLSRLYDGREALCIIELLLEKYFGISRIDIALNDNLRLNESELLQINSSVKELLTGKPIQYLLGETEFCGLKFVVDENVLIPRPETAEIVERIIENSVGGEKILDLGTGSGCIAVTLAKKIPEAAVTAIDISDGALSIARRNAEYSDAKVDFRRDDILNLHLGEDEQFDIIVSNPPYICESEKSQMHKNVKDFEPSEALFVHDCEPFIFYRAIFETAERHLKENGIIYLEINERFGAEMKSLASGYGFGEIMILKDFREKERCLTAKKKLG